MYRDEVTVPRCHKCIGDVVSTCARCVSRFACLSVRQCFIRVSENRRGTGGLGDPVIPEWLGTMRREAGGGETKVTNVRVYWRVPPAKPRAVDRTRGFRARAARYGGPDAEGVSSTTRGRGRWRRT